MLILENGIIPPNVNFEKLNPKIPAKKWNLQFPTNSMPWPSSGLRRISANSFGVGGTNAHTILDDAYSFLREHGMQANHSTVPEPPSQQDIDAFLALSSRDGTDTAIGVNSATTTSLNGTSDAKAINVDRNEHVNDLANGHDHDFDSFGEIAEPPNVFTFSAFDEAGVHRNATAHQIFWQSTKDVVGCERLSDAAHTLARRSRFPWRSIVIAKSASELAEVLTSPAKPLRARSSINVGYVLTGQGAQHYAMARELLCYPVFRCSLRQAAEEFSRLGAQWSLLEELSKDKDTTRINEAYLAQPACTAIQIALIDLLHSWNVRPSRVVGHSSGEIAAAFCAGKLTRSSALKVAYARGVVSSKRTSRDGAMLAAGLSSESLQPYIRAVKEENASNAELVVACVNSPKNCTVSGDETAIDSLRRKLDADGLFARKLNVRSAYHSTHMREVAGEYLEMLGDLQAPSKPPFGQVQMFSTITGRHIEDGVLHGQYWVDNLTSPVQFSEALEGLCFSRAQQKQASMRAGTTTANVFSDILVEIGPHGALQSAIKESVLSRPEGAAITSLTALNRSNPGPETLLNTVGQLYCRGVAVDIDSVNRSASPRRNPRLLVNLPGYAFNHSQKFWQESRLSKNYRLRQHARHDLFGAPVPDWNPETPRWRHFLRVSEQPWLRDHVVTNAIVYPGVGYLIAAVEAARQMAEGNRNVKGFRLKDVSLKRALVIPDNKDGVETMFSMSAFDEASLASSTMWRRFEMRSFNATAENWIEHCTGYVAVEYDVEAGPIDGGREDQEERRMARGALERAQSQCMRKFDISQTYENLVTTGLRFGPLFRNVSDVTGTPNQNGQVLGTVSVPDVAEGMPKRYLSPHLIHPATMDSFMHFALAAIMDSTGKTNLESPTVPTFIKNVYISADLNSGPGHQYLAHGRTSLLAFEKYESDVTVWGRVQSELQIKLEGIRATPLDSAAQGQGAKRQLCHEIRWTPYLETVKEAHLQTSCPDDEKNAVERSWNHKLQLTSVTLIMDALKQIEVDGLPGLSAHLSRYLDWMKQIRTWLLEDNISAMTKADWEAIRDDQAEKEMLYEAVTHHNANGKLAVRMGQAIAPILRGTEDPLQLMFAQDDILDEVYSQVAFLNELPSLQREYLGILADNRTNLRVLEVGAGTGSSTVGILDALAPMTSEDGRPSCSIASYTYTDISSAFFEKAREKFKAHDGIMEYRVFDGEQDPIKQGYESRSYDLVVAQNVVHATSSLKSTLSNVHKLLKPGGRLLLQEGVRQDYFWSGIAFGLLPGWWLGVEPERKWSPWISSGEWDSVLKAAGFEGTELELRDSAEENLHTQSLFVAKAGGASRESTAGSVDVVIIVPDEEDVGIGSVAVALKTCLQEGHKHAKVAILRLADLGEVALGRTICICIAELQDPVLAELSEERYNSIRRLLVECKGLLWVTGDVVKQPMLGMITGLLRTVRWERDLDEANLVALSISASNDLTENETATVIGTLFAQQHLDSLPQEQYHGEYTYHSPNKYLIARLHPSNRADDFLTSKFNKLKPVPTKLKDAGRPIKLSSAAPGILDKLEWVTDESYYEPLGETEVEIEIRAVGLNFRDLMIAMGEHMAYSIGSEGAGKILGIGFETETKLTICRYNLSHRIEGHGLPCWQPRGLHPRHGECGHLPYLWTY